MRINDKHIFTLSGELIQGRGSASHEMLLYDNSKTIPIGRGFVHGQHWKSSYPSEGTLHHYLSYAINDNIGMSDMNYTYMAQKAKPKHYEPALRTLLHHYSQNPERKFIISLGIGDEEDPSHPVLKRYQRATGREAPFPHDGYVDLTSIDDIKNFLNKSKAEIKRKRLSRELPAVDTSRLGTEPPMAQGNMTTAEWNFWRRKGLGDSYMPIMTFKTFLSESNAEAFRKKFDTIVNSPEFKRLSASQSIDRDNPTENPWQLTGHNPNVGIKGTSPEIEAMKEKVFGKRQGNSHLWWYHQDHGLVMHPAIGDLTHRDVEDASEWNLQRNNADRSVVKKIAPEKPGIIDSIRTYFGSAPEVPAWITAKNKILAKGRIENHEGGGGLISYTPGEEVETTGLNQSKRSVDSGIVRTLSRKFPKHQIHDGLGNLIENTKHKRILSETIRKIGDEYTILSKKGKRLGKYGSKEAALKRLKQIEWFKRHRNY